MRSPLRFIKAAAVLASLALVSSACGGTSDSSDVEAPSEATFGMAVDILTLDPNLTFDTGNQALHLIGGTLYNLEGGQAPEPGLADGPPEISDDQLTWTIKLKPDLTFSDKTPITSADVKATFERAKNDKENINAFLWDAIDSATTPDDLTVVFSLNRPYPSLTQVLGVPFTAIFPADRIEDEKFFEKPISAGPYTLVSWKGDTAVFEENPNYSGSAVTIPKVTMKTISDPNTRLSQVKSGQLQLAYALPPNLISQITSPVTKQVQPLYGLDTLSMNTKAGMLDEVGVRRAISLAIDREKLSEIAWNGEAEPLAQLWPSTMTGHDSSISADRDVAGAKKALQGTSCEAGCEFKLTYSQAAYPQQEQEAPIIKSSLAEIGIDVSLNNVDPPTYFDSGFTSNFDLVLTGLYDFTDIPDSICPLGVQGLLLTNFSGFELPGIDEACNDATTMSGEARDAAMKAVNEILLADVPWTPLTGLTHVDATSVSDKVIIVRNTLIGIAREDGSVW